MIKDHCPLCKSKKLYFIDPYESREKIKSLLTKTNMDLLPDEMKSMIEMLSLDQEMSESEKEFYNQNGRKVICQNCGMSYYENLDYTELENKNAHPVTREEYIEHLKDYSDDLEFNDFVIEKTKGFSEYYIEALDELIKEYSEVSTLSGKTKNTMVN